MRAACRLQTGSTLTGQLRFALLLFFSNFSICAGLSNGAILA